MLTEGDHAYVNHEKTVIIHASLVRHHLNDLDTFLPHYRTLCAQVHVTTTAVTLKVCRSVSTKPRSRRRDRIVVTSACISLT
jgi:hypothetical protein